jgi:cytochrome oxidase assembly protein ShyY1
MLTFFRSLPGIISLLLALGMARASFWQWDRHIEKQRLLTTLEDTLKREPIELLTLIGSSANWGNEVWRRVHFSGTFNFEHEVVVRRNRGSQEQAGFHVVTPLKLDNSDLYVLVDRGFLPLGREDRSYRKRYQEPIHFEGYGLIKASSPRKFLAPSDPAVGSPNPWADIWIRVHIEAMSKQLPYTVLPVYLEVMESPDDPLLPEKIVKEGAAGRNDVLSLTGQKQVYNKGMDSPDLQYPVPQFDTTPPPDIHLGYVYEWAFMALLTVAIGAVIHLGKQRRARNNLK